MMRLALAAMMLPAAAAQASCTSAACCTEKVTGMCGLNTHDENGLLTTAAAFIAADTACGSNSELIAAAATTTKPTGTGAAAAAAICCMCPDGFKVDATFDGCTACGDGKYVAASTNRATATECADVAKCSTFSCATGNKKITDAATTACVEYDLGTGACTAAHALNEDVCCEANACEAPGNTAVTGYDITTTAGTTVSGLGAVTCTAATHAGTADVTCAGDGTAAFGYAGCDARAVCTTHDCAAGTTQVTAHATTKCAGATCAATDATTCCDTNECKLPADTTGYSTTGSAATTTTKGALTVACDSGYTGTAAGACAADDGEWALSGCTAKVVTEYCADAADTDDDGSALDTYTCAEDSFALPDVEVTCAKNGVSTGTCTRTTLEPTPYQILVLWMTESPAALGVAFPDNGDMCTATDGTAATCTGDDDGTGTACALNADSSACAVAGGDCVYSPTAVTCTVTVSETDCPPVATEDKAASARSAAPFALVMIAAAALA